MLIITFYLELIYLYYNFYLLILFFIQFVKLIKYYKYLHLNIIKYIVTIGIRHNGKIKL